jgi:hypothetical protein
MGKEADRPTPTKLATLQGVREYCEDEAVELWLNETGRIVVRAYNECGNNYTEVDFRDLLDWAAGGPDYILETKAFDAGIAIRDDPAGNRTRC